MPFTDAEHYNYGSLYAYAYRGYKRNSQGGGQRKLNGVAEVNYYPHGLDGLSGGEIVVSWGPCPLATFTMDNVYVHPVTYLSKPMLRLVNRVLADVAPGHELRTEKFINLYYEDALIMVGFTDGWVFTDDKYFYEINGKHRYNYIKEAN